VYLLDEKSVKEVDKHMRQDEENVHQSMALPKLEEVKGNQF